MITDKSGLHNVGMALLRNNLAKLTPPIQVELRLRGDQQVLSIVGPDESFESTSFGWGDDSPKVTALAEALELIAEPVSFDDLRKAGPSQEYKVK